jgi:hypothetical protein
VKHGHILENYSLQEDMRTETEDNWFTTAFFPYPMASSKKSPSAIFDRFINLHILPKMRPSQPVEMTDEWFMFQKTKFQYNGANILKVYMPNKPNRYDSTSPRVGTYVIRMGMLGNNDQLKNLVLGFVGVQQDNKGYHMYQGN